MNLRDLERESIRAFVEKAGTLGYLKGRVLDYGCGKQPYRSLVESFGAEYVPFDRTDYPANVSGEDFPYSGSGDKVTTILCTQVIQYVPNEFIGEGEYQEAHYESGPSAFLRELHGLVYWGAKKWLTGTEGHLVMTYPTNWPEVEAEDLHRFTKSGMERLLTEAGFKIVLHEQRAWVRVATGVWETDIQSDRFALGYGVVARA